MMNYFIHKRSIRMTFVSLFMTVLFPISVYALGDIHLFAFPGVWSQDLPTTWITNVQLRYFEYDHAFDSSGNSIGTADISGFQSINKVGHAERLSNQVQLTNILILPYANVSVDEYDLSSSGMGDPISTNYIGWHNKANNLHCSFGFSLSFPIGDYNNKNDLNIGENRWKLYFPFIMAQYRLPLSNGLMMFDLGMNCEWRYKNNDTDWDDHDVAEINLIATYWLNKNTMKFGLFVQPDFQFALNESKADGIGQNDDDFYTIGSAFGLVYAPKPNSFLYLKYSKEFDGKGLNNGSFAPDVNALHFEWAYVF